MDKSRIKEMITNNPVVSFLLSVAGSYLAGLLPPVMKEKGLDERIDDCFVNALGDWRKEEWEKANRKKEQLKKELLDYLRGKEPANPESDVILTLWVREMKNDPLCSEFITQNKIDVLGDKAVEVGEDIVSRVSESLSSLERKVDAVRDDTREILKKLNITQFVCLNDCIRDSSTLPGGEISAKSLTDESFWEDEVRIDMVMTGLKGGGYFVIKGTEGRGKSVLSCQVANRLIKEEGLPVFITKKSWTWDEICTELDLLMKDSGPVLVVLENIHESDDTNLILDYCKRNIGDKVHKHLFLMNMRPTDENESGSEINSLGPDYVLDLDEYQKIRSERAAKYWADQSGLNIDELTVSENSLRNNLPPNLRVLSKYFQIYREDGMTDVNENRILHLFSKHFGLGKASSAKKNCLLKLAAINIFDVPLSGAAISDAELEVLQGYEGLCYEQGGKWYLPHSTDAVYLFKALCDRGPKGGQTLEAVYEAKVKSTIIKYFDTLVEKNYQLEEADRDDIARDFLRIIKSASQSECYSGIVDYYRVPKNARVIIRTICPQFVLVAVVYDEKADKEEIIERLGIYQNSIERIKANLSNFPYGMLSSLYRVLRHYDGYEDTQMVEDIFGEIGEIKIKNWLLLHKVLYRDSLYKAMVDVPVCKRVIDEINITHPGLFKGKPKAKKHYINLFSKGHGELTRIVNDLEYGNVTIEDVRDRIEVLIQEIKKTVALSPGQSDSKPLSYILKKLGNIDKICETTSFKLELMNDEVLKEDVLQRLESFCTCYSDLFYYSHFYNDMFPEIKAIIREKVLNVTDDSSKHHMRYYVSYIRNAFLPDKSKIYLGPFTEGLLASDVERVVLEEAHRLLDSFEYSLPDFYCLNDLYNDAYPEIKERTNVYVTNIKDGAKRMAMRAWINDYRDKLDTEGKDIYFPKGSLARVISEELKKKYV